LIFKECVNNLAKYSGADEVLIEINIENHSLVVKISDNGRGFDASEALNGKPNGFGGNGLPNIKRRTAILGGSLTIDSQIGKGTTVVLNVPISGKKSSVEKTPRV
jgi:two-component system sensor histidine kinase DegS